MKDADVPLWDKGDKTDDFAQGGSSGFSFPGFSDSAERTKEIEKVYKLVLGRKPTSREVSYYRYSTSKKDEIIKKLLESDEHKDLAKKGRDYPDLEERERLDQNTILKLKHGIEDQQEEFNQMRSLLNEKNKEIDSLRGEKKVPYVTQAFLEGRNVTYYYNDDRKQKKMIEPRKRGWIDKLFDLIQKFSE